MNIFVITHYLLTLFDVANFFPQHIEVRNGVIVCFLETLKKFLYLIQGLVAPADNILHIRKYDPEGSK